MILDYIGNRQSERQGFSCRSIPLSTMEYWIRRFTKAVPSSVPNQEPVFARLPSEQEVARKI